MYNEELNLFMEKISGIEDENVILEETRKMVDRIFETIGYPDEDGELMWRRQDIMWVNDFVESGAFEVCHKYMADKIPYFSVFCTALIANAQPTPKAHDALNSMNNDMNRILTDSNFLGENPTKEKVKIYDGLVYSYCYNKLAIGNVLDKDCLDAIQRLIDAIDKAGMDLEDTQFYNSLWLQYSEISDELFNSVPVKTKEEYEEYLFAPKFEPDIDGRELGRYDTQAFNYLSKYGDKDVSYENKEKILSKIIRSAQVGTLHQSQTVAKYFLAKQDPDEVEALCNHGLEMLADIFGQAVEGRRRNGRRCLRRVSDDEYSFLKAYAERIKVEDGNNSRYIDDVIRARIEKVLSSLYDYSDQDVMRFANKTVNMVEEFRNDYVPPYVSLATVMGMVNGIQFYDKLDENFYRHDIDDKTKDKYGLTKLDYADKALELIFDINVYAGITRIQNPDVKWTYERNGRNMYDSRALRKLAQIYVDKPEIHNHEVAKKAIIDFVRTVSRRADFDLFKEQEISDLIQLAKIKEDPFGKIIETELREGLQDNPSYSELSAQNARKYVKEFLDKYNYVTLTDAHEVEFDKFLQAATVIRLDSKYGVLPKEVTDFIIRQYAIRTTLLNSKSEKYTSVAERAIENTGLIRFLAEEHGDKGPYMYKVRDYITYEGVAGETDTDRNISVKRTYMNDLRKGNLDILNTIFHENTHGGQDYRLEQFKLNSFNEYMMIKEEILREEYPEFYVDNYEKMFIEIEANQVATSDVSGYINSKIGPALRTKLSINPNDILIKSYLDEFNTQSEESMQESQRIASLYEVALNKNLNDYYGTVNDLFDSYITPYDIEEKMKKYPALAYEYKEDGSLKTTAEQIETVFQYPEINLGVMRDVIKYSSYKNSSLDIFTSIDKVMKAVGNKEEKAFIEGVASDKIPETVLKLKMINWNLYYPKDSDEILNGYASLTRIISYIEQNAEGNKNLKAFTRTDTKGRRPLDDMYELKTILEEKFPELASKAKQRGIGSTSNPYKQLKDIRADLEGKNDAFVYEKSHIVKDAHQLDEKVDN